MSTLFADHQLVPRLAPPHPIGGAKQGFPEEGVGWALCRMMHPLKLRHLYSDGPATATASFQTPGCDLFLS
jgi:hypothetical protein